MMKRTPEQETAVTTTANNIVVSASAGSGKTTTMIARISQILALGHTTLDQLLVLTFTEESAKDMRKKLKQQLGDRLAPAELQAAAIGTFHSFCANIVRAWFTVAGVSPSFVVLDEIASEKLKAEIFDKVVTQHYAAAQQAVDLFAASRTLNGLRQVVFAITAFLETRKDPAAWLRDTALKCYDPNLDTNPAVQALMAYYRQTAHKLRSALIDLQYVAPQMDYLMTLLTRVIDAQTYADFHNLVGITFPPIKRDKDFALYDEFHTLRNQCKDEIFTKITKQFDRPAAQITQDIQDDKHIVELLLFLVQQFDQAYTAKKLELKKLDFADLEKYALKVLANPEAVASIRGKYQYIFVDEGQDTNPVQFQIIDLLRGDDKFFYMVGDVKQSIYGFRGCEPEIFEDMTLQDLMMVLRFNKNFRSNDQILQFVNTVFLPLMPDYAQKHRFEVAAKPATDAVKIELTDSLPAQMELIYQQIRGSGRRLGDIAILSEAATHFETLQKYLAARGVTCVIDRATDATKTREVAVLNNLLFAALNPTNTLPRYLTFKNLFGCSNDTLAKIKLGQATPEFDAVLARYHTWARTLSTYEVLTMAATEFGLRENPVVEAFLAAIRGVGDFDTVARYLYLIEHDLVKIEINVGAHTADAVKIMTMHHAKGLEFPMVILFDLGQSWDKHGKKAQIALDKDLGLGMLSADPDNFVKKSAVLRLGIEKRQQQVRLQEKIRLLYVALTRAKEYLYLVGSWQPEKAKLNYQCMLDLINPTDAVVRDAVTPSPESPVVVTPTTAEPVVLRTVAPHDTLVKQSVTALALSSEPFADYVAPVKYADEGGKEFGTAFHKKMQYGALPEMITQLVAGYTLYKELPFLYTQDQTIVQGIIDLLAVKGQEAIIVDYKTTRVSEAQLVQKYRAQLQLYAAALPDYTVKTYIYSTVHQKLIAVSY